ncbi:MULTISPECIES: hypothetical protein [Sphingobacterium]|uniref:hypothetical protein n=1 Tax=Sphingobacterium TaxID=28453 RepID=UPI0013D96BF3|nr:MULTISPECIES: hypothetical protein [unclassified Sphingobacterium]
MKKLLLAILLLGFTFQSHGMTTVIQKNEYRYVARRNSDSSLFNLLNLINKNLFNIQATKRIGDKTKNNDIKPVAESVSPNSGLKDTYKLDQKNIFLQGERRGVSASELSDYNLHEINSISILLDAESIGLKAVYGSSSAYGIIVLHPKKKSYKKKRTKVAGSFQNVQRNNLIESRQINDMLKEIQLYLKDIGYTPDTEAYIMVENKKSKLSGLTTDALLLYDRIEIKLKKSKKAPSGTIGIICLKKDSFEN